MKGMAYVFKAALFLLNYNSDLTVLTQELCLQDQFSCFNNFIVSYLDPECLYILIIVLCFGDNSTNV